MERTHHRAELGLTVEDGHRTFALSELMVRQPWTGQGIAHTLGSPDYSHARPAGLGAGEHGVQRVAPDG
ncbi:MAG: hypothetical protein ACRDQ4_13165 [Pseudonocardiaceae bacterium]